MRTGGLISNRAVVQAMGTGRGWPSGPPPSVIARLGPGRRLDSAPAGRAARASIPAAGVRVHTGASAAAFTASLGARAATVGTHIALGSAVAPGTHEGRRVIDHELVHVAQRTPKIARNGKTDTVGLDDAGPSGIGTPEADGLDPEDLALLEAEIQDLYDEADLDFVLDQIGEESDEAQVAFWDELAEDPRARAVKYRAALILREASIKSTEQLYEYLDNVETWAESEEETALRAGLYWQRWAPWAFPDTWADLVQGTLQPPAGLETEAALIGATDARAEMMAVAERMPSYLWDHGLPVPFASAIRLSGYPFHAALACPPGTHVVYEFAREAEDYLPTEVTYRLATGWAAGKARLVNDVRAGRKTIFPVSWDAVSAHRAFQPDLSQLAEDALDRDIDITASMGADNVDLWHYELALAKLSGFLEVLFRLNAAIGIAGVFAQALRSADVLVANASAEERLDQADAWATAQGYPAAARAALVAQLKANAGQIAVDVAKDVAISLIPFIGWGWRIKEAIEEVADWYSAGQSLVEARERAESATTVVALQRAAAAICSAEMGVAAQVVLTAASKGADLAVGSAVKAVKGSTSEAVDVDARPAAEPDLDAPDSAAVPAPVPEVAPAGPSILTGPAPTPEVTEQVRQAIEAVEAGLRGSGTGPTPPSPPGLDKATLDGDVEVRLLHGTDQSGLEGLGAVGVGKIDVSRGGGEHQDLGAGFYMALDTATAEAYASRRVAQRGGGLGHVLEFRLPVADLGRVVDIRRGGPHREQWEAFLDKQPFPMPAGLPVPEAIASNRVFLAGAGVEIRGTMFEEFLGEIKMADADTIIAPLGDDVFTGITAGRETAQLCIRSQKVADRLNAQIRGVEGP